MPFKDARTRSFSSALALVLSFLLVEQSIAQQPSSSAANSKMAEASEYLSKSDKALECNPTAAEDWAKKALETVSVARETDQFLIDALGDLKSQSNLKITAAQNRLDELNAADKAAQAEIQNAHPQAATTLLNKADPDGCYEKYKAIRAQIDQRESQAQKLVNEGDAAVAKHPSKAIGLYKQAEGLDAQLPDLAAKLANAQDLEHKKVVHTGHAIRNWVIFGAIMGAVVVALIAVHNNNQNNNGS